MTFDAFSLTTHADRRRKAALDKGQLARTLLLFVLSAIAMALAARQSQVYSVAVPTLLEQTQTQG